MQPKQTVKIFLAEGNPTGLRSLELFNWNGKGFVIPRDRIDAAIGREELKTQGVYILIGENEDGKEQIYIGESENLADRLRTHKKERDFWEVVVCFFSKDANLNKAHVKYLEEMLIQEAYAAGRVVLENHKRKEGTRLSESDASEVIMFAENVKLILATIGYTFLKKPTEYEEKSDDVYVCQGTGLSARGIYSSEGMVVLAGSEMRLEMVNSGHDSLRNLRQSVIDAGAVEQKEDKYVFTKDYIFRTPSGAAGAIMGRNINGWQDWKRASDSKTLDEVHRKD